MCPQVERYQRHREKLVHKLEWPGALEGMVWISGEESRASVDSRGAGVGSVGDIQAALQRTMIKRYQRSSADHNLQIPELLRTPAALYQTVKYIEENILMLLDIPPQTSSHTPSQTSSHKLSNKLLDASSHAHPSIPTHTLSSKDILSIYLLVFDRYRMVHKDLCLQPALRSTSSILRVRVLEHVVRAFVYLDWYMCHVDCMRSDGHSESEGEGGVWKEYVGIHRAHHLEQLGNLLKTLMIWYAEYSDGHGDGHGGSNGGGVTSHKDEFVGYYIIFLTITQSNEVCKFLRTISPSQFHYTQYHYQHHVDFAIRIHVCVCTNDYNGFFKLYRSCSVMQACMMYALIVRMRLRAIQMICKACYAPSPSSSPLSGSLYPLNHLNTLLACGGLDECVKLVKASGLEVHVHTQLHTTLAGKGDGNADGVQPYVVLTRTFSIPSSDLVYGVGDGGNVWDKRKRGGSDGMYSVLDMCRGVCA